MKVRIKTLKTLTYGDRNDIANIIQLSNNATVFNMIEWHEAVNPDNKNEILIAYENQRPVGYYIYYLLPIYNIFYIHKPYTLESPYGYPISINNRKDVLIKLIQTQERRIRSQYFQILSSNNLLDLDLKSLGYNKEETYHMISKIEIVSNSDQQLQSFKKSKRWDINKAIKNNVKIVQGNIANIEEYYQMHKITSKRLGIKPRGKILFTNILNYLETRDYAEMLLAYHDDEIIAGLINLISKRYTYYWNSVSSGKKRELQATSLLIWESIKRCIERQQSSYYLLGIDKPFIARFKKPFNGIEEKIDTYVKRKSLYQYVKKFSHNFKKLNKSNDN